MTKDDIKILIAIAFVIFGLPFSYYKICEFRADRYNQNFGTNFTAIDIMLGLDKQVRDLR